MKYPEYSGTYYDKFKVTEIDDGVVTVKFFSELHEDWIEAWAHTEIEEITIAVENSMQPESGRDEDFDIYQLKDNAVWELEYSNIDQEWGSRFIFNHHIQQINQVLQDTFADSL